MTATATDDKPARLLAEGRVTVWRVSEHRVDATVQGDTDVHRVCRTPGGWECDCPGWSYRRRCSHTLAVQLVTTGRPAP